MELKRLKDIEKLHKVENFILSNGRQIKEKDKDILTLIEGVMDDYTYGWYILEEDMSSQLKSINQFKIYIIDLEH